MKRNAKLKWEYSWQHVVDDIWIAIYKLPPSGILLQGGRAYVGTILVCGWSQPLYSDVQAKEIHVQHICSAPCMEQPLIICTHVQQHLQPKLVHCGMAIQDQQQRMTGNMNDHAGGK
eukprot:2234672-Karenia_brevis.AAC.1